MPRIYEKPNEYVVFCFVFYIRGDRGELLHGQVVTTFTKIKTKCFKRLGIGQSIT